MAQTYSVIRKTIIVAVAVLALMLQDSHGQSSVCSTDLLQRCQVCDNGSDERYDCSLPGLSSFTPGQYEGVKANYLSFVTDISSPNMPIRAREFEACTGAKITFSEANNVWEDPVRDIGTKGVAGSELYDGYFMSYSHFPEVSALGLAEHLNDRIRADNDRLKWEDIFPKVRAMGEYRSKGETNIDFLMYDGDFFVPMVRLDLLEKYELPLPNTWQEVVDIAKFFGGKDLNEDGEPDFGLCHFPRVGAGNWDWWFSEIIYSTWATTDQTQGTDQGFFFDVDTMEPRTNATQGLRNAASIWKDLWKVGTGDARLFREGRCAIGYGPPGEWKAVAFDGVKRTAFNQTSNETDVIWQPTLSSGKYAEPYRLKPFGSVNVSHPVTGELVPCDSSLCPKAELIPPRGHLRDDDKASLLPPSPLQGRLINRAPFYWSGGLGTMIRNSSTPQKKDVMWDFFVYTNSPDTSVEDIPKYESWLDSWRYSQLLPGDNFLEAGWSPDSYEEHLAMQQWGLSSSSNGAFNLRLPGVAQYTRDVMGKHMTRYIDGEITLDELVDGVTKGWEEINQDRGKLHQLETYRASLGLDEHTEVELCRLHRDLMDERDPSICRKYDPSDSSNTVLIIISISAAAIILALGLFLSLERRRRNELEQEKEFDENERDEILEIEKTIYKDNFRISLVRLILLIFMIVFGVFFAIWIHVLISNDFQEGLLFESPEALEYAMVGFFFAMIIGFAFFDWLVRVRNKNLVLNAAKSSEIISTMFPKGIREQLLSETRANKKANIDKHNKGDITETSALAELYPRTTIMFAGISGFAAWSSSRKPEQVFSLLESVFGIFDLIARHSQTYKVETSSERYVAITGAPNDQIDHAERMCRFAARCVKRFSELSRKFVVSFGPDTAELALQVGIHSGQVTMGVLRNDRARYQLFGDCVNKVAHLQSTSQPGRIHISRDTANLLQDSGRDMWFAPRKDVVHDKSKERVEQTFWLDGSATLRGYTNSIYETSSVGASENEEKLLMGDLALHRLVEWNTSILLGLLKKIIAHRQHAEVASLTDSARIAFSLSKNNTFVEEVVEIIHLPSPNDFDNDVVDLDAVNINPIVTNELRELVKSIASLYNANPFHNFEHASHVTMSVVKLMSRIVKPSEREEGNAIETDHDRSYGITSDPLTQFAAAFCGLCHDADHPGVGNGRMVEEDPALGARYKERSVAEQNSLSLCFDLLSEDRFINLHRVLFRNNEDQARFRQLVVNSVMATDIFDKELKELRNGRWNKAFSEQPLSESPNLTVNRKATIVIEHLIQASDVAHTMQHWDVYRKWNERLLKEMYLAYKHGRSQLDPTINWAKGEIGFFDFYIIPLAKKLADCGVFGVSSDEYLNYAIENRRRWEEQGAAITAEMVERLKKDDEAEKDEVVLTMVPEEVCLD